MAKIYVNFREIREANYSLLYIVSKADYVKRQIYRCKREMPDYLCDSYQIGQRLDRVYEKVEEVEHQVSQLHKVVNCCVKQYETVENENSRNAEAFL